MVPLAAVTGFPRGRALWLISVLMHGLTWLSFSALLVVSYGPEVGGIQGLVMLGATRWSPPLSFHWDFWSLLLAWVATTTVLSVHFLSLKSLQGSRALVASTSAYLACVLAAVGAAELFLFCVAMAGLVVPKFVMICLDESEERIGVAMESAVISNLALLAAFIVVLASSGTGAKSMPDWLAISGVESEVASGTVGFALIFVAAMALSGIFPFHFTNRKIFSLVRVDAFAPQLLQSILGFLLLFRFATSYFPAQLTQFHEALLYVYSGACLLMAVGFWGAEQARDRIFWLQQVLSCFAVVGFLSLTHKGWHGSSALIAFQAMAIPVLLLLSVSQERRGDRLSATTIGSYPLLGSASILAPLIALCSPLSLGFYCLTLVFWSLSSHYAWAIPVAFMAVPICAFSGMRIMFFRLGSASGAGWEESREGDFSASEKAALLPAVVLLLLLGFVPGLLLTPIGGVMDAMLKGLRLGF